MDGAVILRIILDLYDWMIESDVSGSAV